jgi:hypothetical protein
MRDRRYETHPVLELIRDRMRHRGAPTCLEALYGFLLLSGNGYLEAVPGGTALPGELHVLAARTG